MSERSFWGWGVKEKELPPSLWKRSKSMLQMALGLDKIEEKRPPTLEDIDLRPPRFALPDELQGICTQAPYERARHSYGKAYRDVVRAFYGQFENPPDYVAFPKTEDDLLLLMSFCSQEGIALIPYGGGSSVVGGIEPPRKGGYPGAICCDMKHFDKILHIDPLARTARIQAGILGPALEAGLKPHGKTLRHFPQSFEFSTLGGWIATRAGGHFATVYTHIDDFVQSIRMVTPQGIIDTRPLPGSGAGPDPNRFLLGSEGILGIITEATVRLQDIPTFRAKANISFSDEKAAIEAVRLLSQSGLFPSNCRLISPLESFSMGIGDGSQAILLLGFESHDHDQNTKLTRATEIAEGCGGSPQKAAETTTDDDDDEELAERWKTNFLMAPYLRDAFIRCGFIMETFETAVTWDRFEVFQEAVLQATQQAVIKACGVGFVMWRFTHVYPDGPAPYYTVIAKGKEGEEVQQWDTIKRAASDAIIEHGGTITHHHAVGKDHQPWYAQQNDPLFEQLLANTKQTLDPAWILNPEVLLPKKPK